MEKFETIKLPAQSFEPETENAGALCPIPEEEEEVLQQQLSGIKGLLKKLDTVKSKIHFKPFPWKALNARNALIASCIALIVVAGYLNVRFSSPVIDVPSAPTEGEAPAGNDADNTGTDAVESFFAQAVISRERVRDEAIDVLRELTEDESADAVARQDAYEQMNRLADEISSEVNIENLIKSKGFQQCVAVVSQDNVNVIVQSEGLTPGEVAQIKEIVYVQTGVLPKNIKIIEKSAENTDQAMDSQDDVSQAGAQQQN